MVTSWWQPPRLRAVEAGHHARKATWLELFYDLVFVVAVAELAHTLAGHLTLTGLAGFVALFVPIWWAWAGATFYNDRFDTDDTAHRLLAGAQVLAVAALAVNVHDALGASSTGFALSYAAVRGLLIFQYLRVGRHIAAARPLARRYVLGFSLAAALWLVSVLVPPPFRFVLWALALAVDLITPLTARRIQATMALSVSHLPERFGLFTILVLGESVAGVVRGVAEQHWDPMSAAAASLGFAVAFSLWWIYFDNLDHSVIRDTRFAGQVWTYTHLPLAIGLTALGVAVEQVVASPPGEALSEPVRWLVSLSVALCLLAIGVIGLMSTDQATGRRRSGRAAYRFGAAAAAVLIGALDLSPLFVVGLLAILCAGQVVLDRRGGPLPLQHPQPHD